MKYQHLIEKMQKYQDKISKNTDDVELPADLKMKMDAAEAWLQAADMKLGSAEVPSMTPDIDPMLDYSNALGEYSEMFSKKAQSEITELQELIEELYHEVTGADSHPM